MPATMTTMPPTTGVRRAVPGEIRAARSNPQSARVANTPNRPQATRYPDVNNIVGTKGSPRRRLFRLIVAKVRIIGAALGSIMPGIIAHQITKLRTKSAAAHGVGAEGRAISAIPSVASICR